MRIVPMRRVRIVPMKLKIKLPKVSSETEIVSFDELDRSIKVFPSYAKKVSLKTVKNNCYDGVSGMSKRPVLLKNTDGGASAASDMKQIPNKNKLHINSSNGDHPRLDIQGVSDIYLQSSVSHASNKRGPVRKLEGQRVKKQKIDNDQVMVQCLALLNKLINDKRGWGFRNPVDPVALNIPDYFSIISNPMDLGTIKSKLEKELYAKTEEFAADVRLMFNNAMIYNPPANYFHVVAKELRELFESRLKVLESKWSAERLRATQLLNSDERLSTTLNMKQDTPRSSQASCPKISENVSTISVPKQKRREALVEIPKNKFSQPLLYQRDDEVTACKPQKVTRSCHHSRSVENAHTQNSSGRNSLQKDFHEGIGYSSRQASVSISNKSKTSSACMNGSWESMNSLVSHHNSFSSDSERSSARANSNACHVGVRNLPPLVNVTASRQMSKAEKAGIEAQIQAVKTASRMKEEMKLKMQREQEREAARIALEKMERTVEIYENLDILKDLEMLAACSVQDNFLVHRLERQGLFMKHEYLEDEEELESCSQVVEMEHCNIDLKVESKMQREREREAARIALQKVERSVEFYESLEIMKDLQMLGVFSEQDNFRAHPLERLGLFLKDEYLEDEEELESCSQVVEVEHYNIDLKVENCSADLNLENNNADVEEGEIVEQ